MNCCGLLIENKHYTDFSPRDYGYEECSPQYTFGPAIRSHYLIHYIEKGKGTFKNEECEYHLKAGDAFLIRPGEVTWYCADKDDPWSYIWIGFKGKLSEHFADLPDILHPDESIFTEIKTFPKSMIEERLVSSLFKLYCNIFEDRVSPDYANKVIGFINSHYMEKIKIEEIADYIGLNRKYLSRIFKQKTGLSMQEFLIKKRLTEAKKLIERGYNVGEAGMLCGYGDAFAFSKAFKSFFGESPKAYKKNDSL